MRSRFWFDKEWLGPLTISLFLLVSEALGQDVGQGSSGAGDQAASAPAANAAEPTQQEVSGFVGGGGGPVGALPMIFGRHFVSSFSAAEVYERGILNGSHSNAIDTYTDASAAFHYSLPQKHSEYTFDYAGSARHYQRSTSLDVISHSAAFGQVTRWTPRLFTSLRYRFSLTPDYSGELLQESISRELSLASPAPVPETPAIPAEEGLVTLRSNRMTHIAGFNLGYQPTLRTVISLGASAQRMRYQDNNLFGGDRAGASAQIRRRLSPRTSFGIGYQGSGFRQSGGLDNTVVHSGTLLLDRQLNPNVTVSFAAGRWWSHSAGRDEIPLSPLLSDLLGKPALVRAASRAFSSWTGSAILLSHWQWPRADFSFRYNRGITNLNLLSRPAHTQSFALGIAKQLGRSASLSGSIVYLQEELFTLRDSDKLDQGTVQLNFSRKLVGGLDFSLFANYSKLLSGTARSSVFDHAKGGIRLSYRVPTIRPIS